MKSGWVKTYRQLVEWEWYQDSQMVHLLIHLILSANYSDQIWRGQRINRGQLLTSRRKLSIETGISEQSIRTCLERLQSTNEITTKSTNKYTIITITKYDVYQDNEDDDNQQINQQTVQQSTNNQPAINQPSLKNNKNNKKDNNTSGAKAPVTLHTICKNYFHEKFRQLFSDEYYWEAKDAANLNSILKKIKYNREMKSMPNDDNSVTDAFRTFLNSIRDEWILKNYSMSNINSKFNEIISQAKNGRTKQKIDRPTQEELSAAIDIGMALAAANKK